MFCDILVVLVPFMFLCLVRFTVDVATSLAIKNPLTTGVKQALICC